VDANWETREQLLAAARAAGHPVSPSQLGRLYRADLISRPQVHALGRGRGTESRYPPGTAARLTRVMEARSKDPRLTHVAWRLWWEEGGQVPPAARKLLIEAAKSVDAQREWLAKLLAGDETGEAAAVAEMDQLYTDVEKGRVRGQLGEVRRNVGSDKFATVVRVLAEVSAGRFTAGETEFDPEEGGGLVERAFGLERARTDRLAGSTPWLTGLFDADLEMLSEIIGSLSMRDLAESDASKLDLARGEIRSLIDVVTTIGPHFEHLHGRGAFGLGTMARFFAAGSPRYQALILLAWLTLRTNDTLRAGLEKIAAVAPQASATTQLYGVISQLREEVPVLAPVLSDERLAAAQLDENAAIALNAEIARLREDHTESFDAFFRAHPETERLISVIEAH
jgi:hypothetical protein